MSSLKWLLFCLLASVSLAAETGTITPVFSSPHWIAGLNVPFRVKGVELPASVPVKAEVISGSLSAADCKIMRDPFIPQNFILRCLKPGTVSLRLTVNPPTTINPFPDSKILNYGPLTILKLEGLKPPTTNPGPGEDPQYLAGRALFNSHCTGCHHTAPSLKGRTASEIIQAINSKAGMAYLQGVITATEAETLAIYLKTP